MNNVVRNNVVSLIILIPSYEYCRMTFLGVFFGCFLMGDFLKQTLICQVNQGREAANVGIYALQRLRCSSNLTRIRQTYLTFHAVAHDIL